ncbi:MAG TPA: DUF1553 domain-containing protein, partial [Planctomycetaceae bacterium]|nr:DUF1553 domain-containing protein [Planctomycetaceae bacterium]
TYKSVTFRFDHSEDQSYDNFVYTSAYEAGPKVQIAYTRDGKNTYPPQGQVGKPIKVGETYELKFAVREMLVNVWLNGEFLLAHRLPDRCPGGRLSLSGFDATVAFDSLTIESLPADVELQEVKGSGEKTSDPETAVKLAAAKLNLEQSKLNHLRAVIAADTLRYSQESDKDALSSLTRQAATLEAESMKADAEYQLAAASGDANKTKAAEAVLAKANQKLAAIEKGDIEYSSLRASLKALETPAHTDATYPATYPETSTGRRLALAKWMTSRENPLTARVIVNQVWMRHFGQPLVESVFDFGLRSKRPEHADLLDFLSADFIESGWSFRHLHRLIVTSRAYQLSSSTYAADEATLANDSTNQYYWRMNARRMESELVRDCLLQLGGELD